MNFSNALVSGSFRADEFDFSGAFDVLDSSAEWSSSFLIKPVDIFGAAIKNQIDQKEVLRQTIEELRETSDTWVYLRRFLQGALLTTCLIAVPAGVWAADDAKTAEKPAVTAADSADASAQDDKGPSTTMPELTVIGASDKQKALSTTKYSGPLNETPQSATVVDQDQMQAQGITTLRDALRDVSGISLAAGEFSQQGDKISVRGFSINHDFFLDGMRDYGSYYRDPFYLSEIEVLKGPSGLLFGDGTTGGVVNQVSKQPSLSPSYEGSMTFGTDFTRRATVGINQPLFTLGSDVGFRLDVMADQANVAERNVTQNSLGAFAPTLVFGIDKPTKLTISYLHEDENSIPDYGIPWLLENPAPVPRQNYYGFLDDYLRTSVDMGTVKLDHAFNDDISISEKARFGNYYRDVRITEPQLNLTASQIAAYQAGSLSLNQMIVTPNELAVYSTETTFDNQTDLTTKFKTAGIKHTFLLGAEEVIDTSDPIQTGYAGVPGQAVLAPNENLNLYASAATIKSSVSAGVTTEAVYVLDTIDLDDQWELIGGLRFDNVDSYYNSAAIGSAPASVFGRNDQLLNWRAGLVFKPQKDSSIYFVSGTSADPSAESLALSSATTPQPPQVTTSFELGTKWGLANNQITVTGALFWDEMDNALVENPNNPTTDLNAGTEIAKGFELGSSGYITKQWEVMAGYTFLRSYYVNYSTFSTTYLLNGGIQNFSNLPLANAPEDTVNFWTTYDLSERFEIGAGLDVETDRQGGKFAQDGVIEDAPGYITFSGMVKYNMDKQISIQANGINLTDAYYIDQIHPGHIVPGAGRTVLVSTNFKF